MKNNEMGHFLTAIDKLINDRKYNKAEKFLKEYIDNSEITPYPVLRKYGHVLRRLGRQEEAIEILTSLLDTSVHDKALFELAFCYAEICDYEKSLEYIEKISYEDFKSDTIRKFLILKQYVNMQLGNEIDEDNEINSCLSITYDEEKALEHIIKHHSFESHDPKKTYFSEDINVKELFYKMQFIIKSKRDLKIIKKRICNCMHFYYNKIGYTIEGKTINSLTIITNNDLQIISMFPEEVYDYQNINNIEENKEIEQAKQKIITRMSQIDKFNQKYGSIN